MSPVPHANDSRVQHRTPLQPPQSITLSFSTFEYLTAAIIIGTLAVASAVILWIVRKRRVDRSTAPTEYVILESSVSIEIGEGAVEIEYEDENMESRISLDTILHSAPAQRLAFEIDKLPTLHIAPKSDNMLARRGRKTLKLQPPDTGEADMALVNIEGGRLTVSPFSSKREPTKLITQFPATRRRTSKPSEFDRGPPSGIATAPYLLQTSWRPFEKSDLPRD